ncbi:hypothetical protein J4710_05985 [Staphylococcus xylosus]|uniref:Uncharacterized protein n=1 Tax=Staphylococcus xylosus TaxID=1288 RepID=A0A939NLS4_STAXY|nr:hypothetical protein [Staphylococcus xylosus]
MDQGDNNNFNGWCFIWVCVNVAIYTYCIYGVTFVVASYRITLLTGMPSIKAIRHYFGRTAAIVVGVSTFLSCVFLQLVIFPEREQQ